jgi:thiol-disulfide isomerase/thioredoxin
MKKYLLTTVLLLIVSAVTAQIRFEHLTLAEAIAKAKKENKPLFVDVHAVWCGPCKKMAATAFVDPAVAEFYNNNFISVKIDGEKNDGPSVMQQYGITAFPTLLYLNADGSLSRKTVGMMDAAALLKRGREAVDPQSSPLFRARTKYYASALTVADLREYISAMMQDQADSLDVFTYAYFNTQQNLDLADQIDFYAFYKHEQNVKSANSVYFLEHPAVYSPEVYTGKIKEWINYAFSSAVEKNDFTVVEDMITAVYPYWEKAETLGQDKASYIAYVKTQYAKYRP